MAPLVKENPQRLAMVIIINNGSIGGKIDDN